MNKPSNSDVYTVPMARFVETFARVLGDPALPHLFFVDGGALAVENALKVAFDWKSRHNEARGIDPALGTRVLHLRGAFHGRSGYTLSLTNTEPNNVARFPKFDWPRIDAPFIRPGLAEATWTRSRPSRCGRPARRSKRTRTTSPASSPSPSRARAATGTSAAVLRGDARAVRRVRRAADLRRGADRLRHDRHRLGVPAARRAPRRRRVRQEDAGVRHHGRPPRRRGGRQRVHRRLRINSTWGGNLVDMVRARRILEVIEADQLFGARPSGAATCARGWTSWPRSSRTWCSTCGAAA